MGQKDFRRRIIGGNGHPDLVVAVPADHFGLGDAKEDIRPRELGTFEGDVLPHLRRKRSDTGQNRRTGNVGHGGGRLGGTVAAASAASAGQNQKQEGRGKQRVELSRRKGWQ